MLRNFFIASNNSLSHIRKVEPYALKESQETLIDDDREFRIRLKVKITYDFIMEILSQSQNMKVIAPVHLKNKVIEIHREAIKMLK